MWCILQQLKVQKRSCENQKNFLIFYSSFFPMLPNGLDPPLLASEASALSIKLRGQLFAKATELKSVYNNGDSFKSIEHSDKKFKGIVEKLHCPTIAEKVRCPTIAEKVRCPAKYLQ